MKNIVVLVSGEGTNLQRIIDATENGEIPDARIVKVIADRKCFGLKRAEKHGISTQEIARGKDFSAELLENLPADTDLIVLAGFLSILDPEVCGKYNGKIINIHPALLPKFGGTGMWGNRVHAAVLADSETESGVTVHFVTSGIDEGEIILQQSFPLSDDETVESLKEKVHAIEYDILPKAINKILGGLH